MVFFACKTKQPVAGSKGRNMCLINTTDLERTGNSFVTALHGMGVLRIKRTSLLIDHDSILFQRIITVSIKFSGKQAFRRAKRIGRIHDDKVIFIFTASDKFQRIFAMVQTRFEKRLTEFTNLINCSHRKAKPKLQKFVEKFCGDVRPDTAAMAATASRNWHAEYCYLPESMYNNLCR